MSVIKCRIFQCPYNKEGNCLNRLLIINENGMCRHLTKDTWQNPIGEQYKIKMEVIDSDDLCRSREQSEQTEGSGDQGESGNSNN